jgi:phosphoenolpyruvate-protein kinase (PTS system EI component)
MLHSKKADVPEYIPFLLGIGIKQLSIDPMFLPLVQQNITRISTSEAEAYAEALLAQPTIKGIAAVMKEKKWNKLIKSAKRID